MIIWSSNAKFKKSKIEDKNNDISKGSEPRGGFEKQSLTQSNLIGTLAGLNLTVVHENEEEHNQSTGGNNKSSDGGNSILPVKYDERRQIESQMIP